MTLESCFFFCSLFLDLSFAELAFRFDGFLCDLLDPLPMGLRLLDCLCSGLDRSELELGLDCTGVLLPSVDRELSRDDDPDEDFEVVLLVSVDLDLLLEESLVTDADLDLSLVELGEFDLE